MSSRSHDERISLLHSTSEISKSPSPLGSLTWRQVMLISMLCFVNYCNFVCYSLIAPFFPKEAVLKGASPSLGSWVFGSYELTAFVVCPLFGRYIGVLGSRFLFVAGLIVTGTACVLFGLLSMVKGYTSFVALAFAVRIVEAVGAGAYITSSYAIAAGEFPTRVGTVQGLMETFAGLGISTGPALGGALYAAGGYWLPFAIMGTILVIVAIGSIFTLPASQPRSGQGTSIWSLLCIPGVLLSSLSIIVGCISIGFYEPTLGLHIDNLVSSPLQVGLIFLASAGTYALGTPLWGMAADFTKYPKSLMILGGIIVAIAFMLLGPVPFLGLKLELWLVILALVIHGIGLGGLLIPPLKDNLIQSLEHGMEANEDTRGLVSGLFISMFSLGAFLGPVIGGSLVEVIGFEWSAFVISGICVALAVLLSVHFLVKWKYDRCERDTYHPVPKKYSLID